MISTTRPSDSRHARTPHPRPNISTERPSMSSRDHARREFRPARAGVERGRHKMIAWACYKTPMRLLFLDDTYTGQCWPPRPSKRPPIQARMLLEGALGGPWPPMPRWTHFCAHRHRGSAMRATPALFSAIAGAVGHRPLRARLTTPQRSPPAQAEARARPPAADIDASRRAGDAIFDTRLAISAASAGLGQNGGRAAST